MSADTDDKAKLIAAFHKFALEGGDNLYDVTYERIGYMVHRGERLLARAIAEYLSGPELPKDDPHGYWPRNLDEYLTEAFVEFRTHKKWEYLRGAYLLETDHEIPDLVDVHIGGLHRSLVTTQLARLCATLANQKWLQSRLESHFSAQQICIDQAWHRFVRIGYRQLMPRIKEERHRGNKGEFGKTTLMTYCLAGRCMFTFMRGKDGGPMMTYVADDSDMYGSRSGSNATATPFMECISMINEVSDNWSLDAMKEDGKIGMGF